MGKHSTAIEGRDRRNTGVEGVGLYRRGRNWAIRAGQDGKGWDMTKFGRPRWNTTDRDSTGLDA